MKKQFAILFGIMEFGWFPLLFICAWGTHLDPMVNLILFGVTFIVCFSSGLYCTGFMRDDQYWKTQKRLEEAIKENQESKRNYDEAIKKLTETITGFREQTNTEEDEENV